MGKSDRGTDFDGRANRALHYQAQCRRQAALDWANKVELEGDDDLPDSYWDTIPDENISDCVCGHDPDEPMSCEFWNYENGVNLDGYQG